MKIKLALPETDYRNFRFSKLNTPEFSHLKWLIFWPIYGILFLFVERFYPVDAYYVMHHPLDDRIPFCEWFVIPYMFWFVYLVGMYLYTLFYDVQSFRRLMLFTAITYSTAIVIYLLFPTCQNLRPAEFERDNLLTKFMAGFYEFDTNTNVCPSIHVMGSVAVCSAAWHTSAFSGKGWRISFTVTAILICMSTVFLKQHSIIDVIAALPICAIAYGICYGHRHTTDTKNKKHIRKSI